MLTLVWPTAIPPDSPIHMHARVSVHVLARKLLPDSSGEGLYLGKAKGSGIENKTYLILLSPNTHVKEAPVHTGQSAGPATVPQYVWEPRLSPHYHWGCPLLWGSVGFPLQKKKTLHVAPPPSG